MQTKRMLILGKVRLILPTFVNKSLWISEDITPHYGLNYIDMNLNECLDSFNCLNQIKGIYFYEFNCDKPSNKS